MDGPLLVRPPTDDGGVGSTGEKGVGEEIKERRTVLLPT